MSDAGGHSGRNADRSMDRSAGDGPTSPATRAPDTEGPAQPATGGSGGGRDASPGPDEGPRPPSWRALISGLLIALVMASIMVTTYVSAQHAVVARNLPWGVTGSSPLTTAVQEYVSLKIHRRAWAGQAPWHTPAGCSDGSTVRHFACFPLLPEFRGSARGTT
ncbi:hypothetical protein GCM10010350_81270 [Streptomyces galilaeus]|nr:hypothetical protein GCM10010350_81270 [Streptomyces galilaeus]